MILKDEMILYHGSYTSINKIDLEKCENGKDFGKGFYLSDDLEQAKGFIKNSVKKAKSLKKIPDEQNFGYVSVFKYHLSNENIPTYSFKTADIDWLWFVSMNRRQDIWKDFVDYLDESLLSAEIVIGKIANDTTNPTIMAYINGLYGDVKSKEAINFAINQLMPNRLKDQCCFKSERTISCLELIEVKRYEQ